MDYDFEQTRFNLHTPIDPKNMATRFKLRPAPIVLQRVPSSSSSTTLGVQTGNLLPFEQRMELASRLAQREIERKGLLQTEAALQHKNGSGVEHGVESEVNPKSPPLRTKQKPSKQTKLKPSASTNTCVKTQRSHKPGHVTFRHNNDTDTVIIKGRSTGMATQDDNGMRVESEIEATSQEILKLRKDLIKNMQRLKLLSLKADLESPSSPTTLHTVNPSLSEEGRLGWIEDKTNEKKHVKAHGQAVRNARMIYQLQQKVREAQKELKAPEKNSKARLLAMHRLASAHRTAIRTLHHLTSVGVSVGGVKHSNKTSHDEVAGLIEQLSRLCVTAHVGGDDSDDHMTSLMKELADYHSHVKHLLRNSKGDGSVPNSPAIMAAKKFLSPQVHPPSGRRKTRHKPKGVLLDPKLRIKRFSTATGNNRRTTTKNPTLTKQSTKNAPQRIIRHPIPTSLRKPRPIHSSLGEPTPHHKSSPLPDSARHHHSPPPPPSLDSLSPSLIVNTLRSNGRGTSGVKGVAELPWEHEGQNLVEKEMARQIWLDKRALDIAEDLERTAEQNRSQHREYNNSSHSNKHCLENKEADNKEIDVEVKQLSKVESRVQMKEYENIVERIQEIERERIDLQTKWQTITYEHRNEDNTRPSGGMDLDIQDLTRPSGSKGLNHLDFVGPSDEKNTSGVQSPDATKHGVSFKDPVHTWGSDDNSRTSDVSIGPHASSNPIVLQNKSSSKLPITDFRINRVLNHKQVQIELIADGILRDLITSTALELGDVMHTCVKQLYDNEFHSPPATTHN